MTERMRVPFRNAIRSSVSVLEDEKPRIGAHEQPPAEHAGGVDDLGGKAADREQVQEPVGHDLHHALPGGGEPQVALVIGHDVADQLVHGDVFKHAESVRVQPSDPVPRADPQLPVDHFQPLHAVQRADVPAAVR